MIRDGHLFVLKKKSEKTVEREKERAGGECVCVRERERESVKKDITFSSTVHLTFFSLK